MSTPSDMANRKKSVSLAVPPPAPTTSKFDVDDSSVEPTPTTPNFWSELSRKESHATVKDDNSFGARLDRRLSRIQTWALDYVDLDFPTQESALTAMLAQLKGNGSMVHLESSSHPPLHISPMQWSVARKTKALFFPCILALLAGYAAGAYAFAGPVLKPLWNLSPVVYNTGITAFVIGFGFAPVALALISELYGRYWVFVSCGTMFLAGTAGCAVTTSFAGMIVSRFFTGAGASVFATLTAGVVSDLFPNEDRHTPMALYSLCLCAGTGVGPLVSGFITTSEFGSGPDGWRWIFYVQMVMIAFMTTMTALVYEETRANVLLAKNCELLNAWIARVEKEQGQILFFDKTTAGKGDEYDTDSPTSSPMFKPPANNNFRRQRTVFRVPSPRNPSGSNDPADRVSLGALMWRSFCFPLQLLFTEPIVSSFSAWISFAWAILYMQFSSIPRIFRDVYKFNERQLGLVYIAIIAGCVVGCTLCIIYDKMSNSRHIRRLFSKKKQNAEDEIAGLDSSFANDGKKNKKEPESRIHFACFGTIALPLGLFMFGWTASPRINPIIPIVSIGIAVTGIFIIYLAVFNYLADAYGKFASSAQAAQSLCRNLLAGIFPLVADALFDQIGKGTGGVGQIPRYAAGESLLGGIAVVLCLVPWILTAYGPGIRAGSKFAQTLDK